VVDRLGFGYSQLLFKRRGDRTTGTFSPDEQFAIVDMRQLRAEYDWIAGQVHIFNFPLTFQPFGLGPPQLTVPLDRSTPIAFSPEFVTDKANPEPGVARRLGIGYALLPSADDSGLLAYGPGRFQSGFQLIEFNVRDTGDIRARLVFLVNRPEHILQVSTEPFAAAGRLFGAFSSAVGSLLGLSADASQGLSGTSTTKFDPLGVYADVLNAATGGRAASALCISKEHLEKEFLLFHFHRHYEMLVGALLTWRQVTDWRQNALPQWVKTGVAP